MSPILHYDVPRPLGTEPTRSAPRSTPRTRRAHRVRRALAAATLGLLALGLAACQSIPGTGPVHEGLANLDQADQPVQFNPGGPAEGASQEEIARGFVRAATSSVDDYAVAREFLIPTYSEQWDPTAGVFIDEGTQPYRTLDDRTGELSLSGLATIDDRGILTPLPPGPETSMRFEFQRIAGEWRISSAPNGIILDRSTFAAVWTSRPIYFLTPDDRLAAETRWFLNRSATLGTQIVSELIAGPAEVDLGAMSTAFPAGTTLTTSSVPVSDGTAHIDLSPELLTGDERTLELVHRQLATSLQAAPGVTRFEVSVDGAVIDDGPIASPEGDSRGSEPLRTIVMQSGVLGPLTGGEVEPLPGIGERIAALAPSAVTFAQNREAAAVRHAVSGATAVSWVNANELVTLDLREELLDPGLDRFGYVWSYARSQPGTILVERPGEEGVLLALPELAGTPTAVRVSPGGNRLAMLTSDAAGRAQVLVTSIVREADARPVALTEQASVAVWLPGTPIDIDWVDELRLVAVSQTGTNVKVTLAPLGQLSTDAGSVSSAVEVSGGGSRSLIRVLDDEGRLYGPQGSGWQRLGEGISFIAR